MGCLGGKGLNYLSSGLESYVKKVLTEIIGLERDSRDLDLRMQVTLVFSGPHILRGLGGMVNDGVLTKRYRLRHLIFSPRQKLLPRR